MAPPRRGRRLKLCAGLAGFLPAAAAVSRQFVARENGPGCAAGTELSDVASCRSAAEALGYSGAVETGAWTWAPRGCFVGHEHDGWRNTYFSSIPVAEQTTGNADYRSICATPMQAEAAPPVQSDSSLAHIDCQMIMDPASSGESVSQWMQDWFVYHNFVRGTALDAGGQQGVFVDVGAFHPIHLSNTLFFERCLGWRGVLVEPNPAMARHFAEQRPASQLVPNCVWSRTRNVVMSFEKDPIEAYIQEDHDGAVPIRGSGPRPEFTAVCRTLEDILTSVNLRRPARVDYLSVDAEAAEVEVFREFPFDEFDISVISVEVQVRNYYELDTILLAAGYAKVAVLGGDHVYARLQNKLEPPAGMVEWQRTLAKDFHAHERPKTATLSGE